MQPCWRVGAGGHTVDLNAVPQILHRLTEARVAHELEKVFLKVILGLLSLFGVEINVRFHPALLPTPTTPPTNCDIFLDHSTPSMSFWILIIIDHILFINTTGTPFRISPDMNFANINA